MAHNKSKAKGSRCELQVKEILIKHTGLNWQRTPQSGALAEEHGLKGDVYIPQSFNVYTIEVKCYKDDHLTSALLSSTCSQYHKWWAQCLRESVQNKNEPLMIFKKDRGKWFVSTSDIPMCTNYLYDSISETYTCLLEEWLKKEQIEWQ